MWLALPPAPRCRYQRCMGTGVANCIGVAPTHMSSRPSWSGEHQGSAHVTPSNCRAGRKHLQSSGLSSWLWSPLGSWLPRCRLGRCRLGRLAVVVTVPAVVSSSSSPPPLSWSSSSLRRGHLPVVAIVASPSSWLLSLSPPSRSSWSPRHCGCRVAVSTTVAHGLGAALYRLHLALG